MVSRVVRIGGAGRLLREAHLPSPTAAVNLGFFAILRLEHLQLRWYAEHWGPGERKKKAWRGWGTRDWTEGVGGKTFLRDLFLLARDWTDKQTE